MLCMNEIEVKNKWQNINILCRIYTVCEYFLITYHDAHGFFGVNGYGFLLYEIRLMVQVVLFFLSIHDCFFPLYVTPPLSI